VDDPIEVRRLMPRRSRLLICPWLPAGNGLTIRGRRL